MLRDGVIAMLFGLLFLPACEDYSAVNQELLKQIALMKATSAAVKNADSPQSMVATLRQFNERMESLHADLTKSKGNAAALKHLIASPPRQLAQSIADLKKASSELRETLAAASLYCEHSQLRTMLVKTVMTLEKTLEQ